MDEKKTKSFRGYYVEETMIKNLILRNRSYRRFYQDVEIKTELLRELVDLARLSPSAGNMQPLKFMFSCEPEKNALIFPCLSWAGYLKEWDGPDEGEKPAAYIMILGDTEITRSFWCNHGIAAQSILLGAAERGLGGCIIGAVDRKKLQETLDIPARYEILLVLALGKPKEKVEITTVGPDGNIEYWRDDKGVHHVPKRRLKDIIMD